MCLSYTSAPVVSELLVPSFVQTDTSLDDLDALRERVVIRSTIVKIALCFTAFLACVHMA